LIQSFFRLYIRPNPKIFATKISDTLKYIVCHCIFILNTQIASKKIHYSKVLLDDFTPVYVLSTDYNFLFWITRSISSKISYTDMKSLVCFLSPKVVGDCLAFILSMNFEISPKEGLEEIMLEIVDIERTNTNYNRYSKRMVIHLAYFHQPVYLLSKGI
jgi:hypothetical protein